MLKQNHMVVEYFPSYFTRRRVWKPRPRRESGFNAGSPSEVTRKTFNHICGFVFILLDANNVIQSSDWIT